MVSLAHHVVSLWFLSCKFPLRKNFVRYIVQGFKNNVLIPCKEEMISAQNPPVGVLLANEDSSLRGRSSSLSSRSSATGSVASGSGAASLAAAGAFSRVFSVSRGLSLLFLDMKSNELFIMRWSYFMGNDVFLGQNSKGFFMAVFQGADWVEPRAAPLPAEAAAEVEEWAPVRGC